VVKAAAQRTVHMNTRTSPAYNPPLRAPHLSSQDSIKFIFANTRL
jgi:hypothetical protein